MWRLINLAILFTACIAVSAAGEGIEVLGPVTFTGDLAVADELSGATIHKNFLILVPDEGARFDVLKRTDGKHYEHLRSPQLLNDAKEIDLEGVCSDGEYVYMIGSHSLARKKLHPNDTYETNRQRLTQVKDEDSRKHLWRLELDESGKIREQQEIKIRSLLKHDEILGSFVDIPSKENGIDIEGVAIRNGKLFVGFRGPVLREEYVPIMVFAEDDPENYSLRFVNLAGRGIRDIATLRTGFLIIGGPVGEAGPNFELYYWDGVDCIPGVGAPGGHVTDIGKIPDHGKGNAEGIAVLEEKGSQVDALLVYDGEGSGVKVKFNRP